MNEIWVPVLGYEGLYEVSNLGRLKCNERKRIQPTGGIRLYPEKIASFSKRGDYLKATLCKNGVKKTISVHKIVYESFNGKTDLQIDHIVEGNKTDNRLCNLQAITNRENTSKYYHSKDNNRKIGSCFHKTLKKWQSRISINNKEHFLGTYDTQEEAHNAYKNALAKLCENGLSLDKPK